MTQLEKLRLADYIIATRQNYQSESTPPERLRHILSMASSKWTPHWNGQQWRLSERVPEGVRTAAEAQFDVGSGSGRLLQIAWVNAFGLRPNADQAYKYAVKAVEVAAKPSLEPRNHDATLGTMTAVVRNNGAWTLPFHEKRTYEGNSHQALLRLMQTLWQGQTDRHSDGVVMIEEARAAVMSAVTLVAWFEGGSVSRAQPPAVQSATSGADPQS